LSLRSPTEFSACLAAVPSAPGRSRSFPAQHPFLGFRPLQRFPAQGSGTSRVEHPALNRPASPGFLNLMTLLCPPRTCRPYFVPDPLLGFDLQSLAPPVQPYAVPGAVALLSFETRSFRLLEVVAVRPCRNRDTRATAPVQRLSIDPVAFRALLHTKVRHFPSTV
jgi:hypothetical protein